jgi:leucyl-tRNA synthetase
VVRRVTEELESQRYHTSIAALMEYTNWLRGDRSRLGQAAFEDARRTLVALLAPFAPHIAEELWARLAGQGSVHDQPWPEVGAAAASALVELPVQVDGRLRDRISVPSAAGEEAIRAAPKPWRRPRSARRWPIARCGAWWWCRAAW